jgi:UDP-N-acetylmuramoylalanine--D-glutamate ligase
VLELPWTRALVIGLGASGQAAARLLIGAGVETRGYDQRAEIAGLPGDLRPFLGAPELPDAAFEGIDLLVLSPGVAPGPPRARARALAPDAAVHGEMSLAMATVRAHWPATPTVLVTGTNGKSTVTAMIGSMLERAGLDPFVGGNLGPPVSQMVLEVGAGTRPRPGSVVLECSSYQLETLHDHPTSVAIILNVAPDHLARYDSMEHYADTKAAVFSGLSDDGLALLDAGDPFTPRLRPSGAFETVLVDGDRPPRVDADRIALSDAEFVDRRTLRVAGRHNAKNALFALLAARHLGARLDACTQALAEFEGLPHRMRRVAEIDGVTYYDDSKATNVSAVLASLDGFARPFVLIAGGQGKGEDLRPLGDLLRAGGRGLVALGEARDEVAAAVGDAVPVAVVDDMQQAVARAAEMARPGDAVVLSPACASWDMFDDFAHRGRVFAEAVDGLHPSRGRDGA